MEHGLTSDDIFWLKKSPGKTWGDLPPSHLPTDTATLLYCRLVVVSPTTKIHNSGRFLQPWPQYVELLWSFSIQCYRGRSAALTCSLTQHIPLSRTIITHQWHAVCFSPFLYACPRLMIQISGVHPDLYRTSPLIQPFSSCHHQVNWSYSDVSFWHKVQTRLVGVTYTGFDGCLLHGDNKTKIIIPSLRFHMWWGCLHPGYF